jgi:beta-lactamase class A
LFAVAGVLLAQPPTALHNLLTRASADFPGKAGIWVKHLTTGETAGVRDGEMFNSASVIKIPVLVLAFQMADKGTLTLDERITIRKEDIRGGSGIFRYHDLGLQPTFRDVLLQMVITSDNTATDLAIAKVGGVARVNAWLKESGYGDPSTSSGPGGGQRLVQTTGDLFAKYNALGPADDRNAKTNADRTYWLGEITPRSVGLMLEAIEKKTIAAAASCDAMLRMMRGQQAGARRLNHFLSVPVAHKTGDFPPVLANDVGIIYARTGPIVVSFLGNAITGNYGEAEDRIGRFAQQLVEYFDK